MAQIKIYGLAASLSMHAERLSSAIHSAVMEALSYPEEKKFHRFIALEEAHFIFPKGRSESYIIIEILMFEGRSVEAKRNLIRLLFQNIESDAQIAPQDVEITIQESPKHNWGIRGFFGDELPLGYKVEV
jgi:phenylpyruvate tautomerase PptA (4-oxalocrotonate tautomerase family)